MVRIANIMEINVDIPIVYFVSISAEFSGNIIAQYKTLNRKTKISIRNANNQRTEVNKHATIRTVSVDPLGTCVTKLKNYIIICT